VRLAVVGTGKMGHAFAGRLLGGGHDVSVRNRSPHKAHDLVARGDREAATPARAAAGADATLTSLANGDVVLGTVTGPEGWRPGLATRGTVRCGRSELEGRHGGSRAAGLRDGQRTYVHQVGHHRSSAEPALLSKDLTGTPEAIVDFITIPPGFIRHMHCHRSPR
jgi:NAD binding domain of 6-phosphogluconate dehydrogenase